MGFSEVVSRSDGGQRVWVGRMVLSVGRADSTGHVAMVEILCCCGKTKKEVDLRRSLGWH